MVEENGGSLIFTATWVVFTQFDIFTIILLFLHFNIWYYAIVLILAARRKVLKAGSPEYKTKCAQAQIRTYTIACSI